MSWRIFSEILPIEWASRKKKGAATLQMGATHSLTPKQTLAALMGAELAYSQYFKDRYAIIPTLNGLFLSEYGRFKIILDAKVSYDFRHPPKKVILSPELGSSYALKKNQEMRLTLKSPDLDSSHYAVNMGVGFYF
jgi:hypothetical protein